MDELIQQIIKDLGIDHNFIRNQRTYEILKESIRNKLKDIYAEKILNEYTAEKLIQEETSVGFPIYKREKSVDIQQAISQTELHMINFFNRKKCNPKEWEDILEKLKSDEGILGKKNGINIAKNKVFISYNYPWIKGAVLMYLYGKKGEVRITKVEERKEPNDSDNIENNKYRFKKREKYNRYNVPISATIKEYGEHVDSDFIKREIIKLKKQYFNDVFENIKKISESSDKNMILAILLSVIPLDEEKLHKNHVNFGR